MVDKNELTKRLENSFIEFRSDFPMKRKMSYSITQKEQIKRKSRVKQAIIEFLNLHPKSRNGEIFHHIHHKMITRVSVKMFNSYLDELVSEAQIEKTEEEKPGRKYPRYSLIPQPEREKYRIFLNDRWIENVNTVIDRLDRQATKISTEVLAERMYAIYSVLVGLVGKQKIMEKFSDHKLLTNQTSHQSIRNLKRSISVQTGALFEILDRLSAKKRKIVLDKMIYLSEKDSLNNLAEHGVPTSDLIHKMMVEYAQNQSTPNNQQRLTSDYMGADFWNE